MLGVNCRRVTVRTVAMVPPQRCNMSFKYNAPADVPVILEFTGNASDEFSEFFQAAYKFAVWVSQVDSEGLNAEGGKAFTFEVSCFPQEGLKGNEQKSKVPVAGYCADGITIYAGDWWSGA